MADAAEAVLVMEDVPGFAGVARCYRLSPPLAGHEHVTIFATDRRGQRETVIVASHGPERAGAAKSMGRLPGSVSGFANHEYALFVAGYALNETEPKEGQ